MSLPPGASGKVVHEKLFQEMRVITDGGITRQEFEVRVDNWWCVLCGASKVELRQWGALPLNLCKDCAEDIGEDWGDKYERQKKYIADKRTTLGVFKTTQERIKKYMEDMAISSYDKAINDLLDLVGNL